MWSPPGVNSWTSWTSSDMLPLGQILQNFNINYHSYADDTQLYVSLSPDNCRPADVLCQCLEEINSWMRENFLQLNEDKTEIILFGSKEKRVSMSRPQIQDTDAGPISEQGCLLNKQTQQGKAG